MGFFKGAFGERLAQSGSEMAVSFRLVFEKTDDSFPTDTEVIMYMIRLQNGTCNTTK